MSQAVKTLSQAEFIAFDLETTGLHPVGAQIVEIGAVRFRGNGIVLDTFQQLVDPRCGIPARATEIHGITNRMVAGQPVIGDVLPRFARFLGDTPVVLMAHNARFDIRFLSVAFRRLRQAGPAHPVIDTCTLARRRLDLPDYKLETIGRHLRLIDDETHRALEDALLLKDVFLHLIGRRPAIRSTDELYQLSSRLSFQRSAAALHDPSAGYERL